jgi:hypothetical protein
MQRALRPIPVSVASVLFASAVAVGGSSHYYGDLVFCSRDLPSGQNINHAFFLALVVGPVALLLILLTRKRQRLLIAVILLAGVALAVAIALVAIDGAMYVGERSCGLMGESDEAKFHDNVAYFYALWGLPLVALLWAAGVLWAKPVAPWADEAPQPTPSH